VERLKTQTTFNISLQQVKKKIIGKVDFKDRMELPKKTDMRVAILDIKHELTVEGIERKKFDYTEDEVKHLTVVHITKHYPTPGLIHMYIDGSATPGEGKAVAGFDLDISTSLTERKKKRKQLSKMEKSKQSGKHLLR
jgi:hypothetical protein